MKNLLKKLIFANLALVLFASLGFAADSNREVAANPVMIEQAMMDDSADYMSEKEAIALLSEELTDDEIHIEW